MKKKLNPPKYTEQIPAPGPARPETVRFVGAVRRVVEAPAPLRSILFSKEQSG